MEAGLDQKNDEKNMRLMGVVVCASAVVLSSASFADCQHYEFAELKSMDRNALEFAYCDAALQAKSEAIKGDTARKLEGLNRARAYSDLGESIANNGGASKADDAIQRCQNEEERIGRLLASRKTSLRKLRAECHLDE